MRIGIVTAGGDAAGTNAAIRAVALSAMRDGNEVLGVLDGWAGLSPGGTVIDLDEGTLKGALSSGGTMLGSIRTSESPDDHGFDTFAAGIESNRLDALVVIGGDGSLFVADHLASRGLPMVGIPKTVDFDVSVTDYCIGFDTAVSVVVESLERMHTTAASHHRVLVCEVMGRDTGWLALMGGLAGGADLMLIPEVPMSFGEISGRLEVRREVGKRSSLVVVAEGVTIDGIGTSVSDDAIDPSGHVELARREIGDHLADAIADSAGVETRSTALGYTQRGGPPVASDRIWPSRLGVAAYEAVLDKRFGCSTAVIDGETSYVPIHDLIATKRRVPADLFSLFDRLL